jgi:DNA-binding response OmpR family regulator
LPILSTLFEFFQPFGYEMETADSGETAIGSIVKNHFDILIVDLMMPGMSGSRWHAARREMTRAFRSSSHSDMAR